MKIGERLGVGNFLEHGHGKIQKAANESRIFASAYTWLEFRAGKSALKKGHWFRAVEHFCKASRRSKLSTRSRELAREQLRRFFSDSPPANQGAVLADFLQTREAATLREKFVHRPFPKNVFMGGTAIPLKGFDPRTGEKGVVLLTYNYTYQAFHSLFRTEDLRDCYSIILEPSFTRAEDPAYALYKGWSVVIQDRVPFVREGLKWLGCPFEAVSLNAGEWVDPDTFYPIPAEEKIYDLVYVASYGRYKRHEFLFETVSKIKNRLRVAIVGFPYERSRNYIEREMKRYGVADRCEIFEQVSFEELNRILNRSRINLMISSGLETANRAMYEAMYANVPTIVNQDCEGIDLTYINEYTGVQVSDSGLADAIVDALGYLDRFSPRAWAMENCHFARSTRILNNKLKEMAAKRGEPWTSDIATKVNRPDPVYRFEADAVRLQPTLDHLAKFIRATL